MQAFGKKTEEVRPLGWGSDPLTAFIEAARQQQFATFVNMAAFHKAVVEFDACFVKATENLTNPQDILGAIFFTRAHAAYRAACGTAMATLLPEAFVLLRSCLEYSGYALHVHDHPQLGPTWLGRNDDTEGLKAMKKAFQGVAVQKTITAKDRRLGEVYSELYERTIDFGGHPNLRGVLTNARLVETDKKREIQSVYLHANETAVAHSLKTAAQIGLCSLHIFQHLFAARFQLLGLRNELMRLRNFENSLPRQFPAQESA